MNNKIFILLMVICLSVVLYFKIQKNEIPEDLKHLVALTKKTEEVSENFILKNIIVYDYDNNKINLLEEIKNKTLVFHYNDFLHCNTCVNATLKIIKSYKKINNTNIIILIKFASQFDFSTFRRLNKLKGYKVYSMKNENLKIPIESLDLPFFFTIDKYGNTQNYKAVIKQLPFITHNYLESIY